LTGNTAIFVNARQLTEPLAEKLRIAHRLVVWASLALLGGIYALIPAARTGLTEEDRFLESLTALVFAAGGLAGFVAFARRRGAAWWTLSIPVVCCMGFLDEVSFGQRLLGFEVPVLRRMPVDGLHDLFTIGYGVFETDNPRYKALYVLVPVVSLIVGIGLLRSSAGLRAAVGRVRGWLAAQPPYPFIVPALLFLFLALVLDLDLLERAWLVFVEELLELNVAVALLFGGLSIATGRPTTRRSSAGADVVPAIVCSGGNPAAVTITQTLGRQGIPVHVLSNMDQPASRFSKYATSCHLTDHGRGGSPRHDNVHEPDSLLDYLIDHVERGVLFPGTDANVRFLARHKRRLLDEGFRLCIPDEEVLTTAVNKSDLVEFCSRHGFPVPQTAIVDSAADLDRVRRELRFPIVLKGVFMKNHCFVTGPDEIERSYERFLRQFKGKTDNPRAVAQEWVPGPPERFAKLYVVCDEQSRVVASHTLRRLRVHIRKDGSQGDTLIAKTEEIQACADRWLPFFEAVRWVGVASMECKLDDRDGEYKVIEINPRPWAILKVSVDCGVNVPQLYYRLALGESPASQTGFEENRYYIRLLWGNIDVPEPWRSLGML